MIDFGPIAGDRYLRYPSVAVAAPVVTLANVNNAAGSGWVVSLDDFDVSASAGSVEFPMLQYGQGGTTDGGTSIGLMNADDANPTASDGTPTSFSGVVLQHYQGKVLGKGNGVDGSLVNAALGTSDNEFRTYKLAWSWVDATNAQWTLLRDGTTLATAIAPRPTFTRARLFFGGNYWRAKVQVKDTPVLDGVSLVTGPTLAAKLEAFAERVRDQFNAMGDLGGGTSLFRGAWEQETLAKTYDFASGIPADFVKSFAGSGVDPTTGSSTVSDTGTAPAAFPSAAWMRTTTILNTSYSRLSLNLAALGITGITRVKFWTAYGPWAINGSFKKVSVKKNGAEFLSRASNSAHVWRQDEIAATSADKLSWELVGNIADGSASDSMALLTGVQIYTASAPYMTGHVVTHVGKLWRSTVDNNATTPGAAGASWVEAIDPISGPKGDKGDTGATGPAGPAGPAGADGEGVLLLDAGAPVPPGTPAGTLIYRKG